MIHGDINPSNRPIWKAIAFVIALFCLMTWIPDLLEDTPKSHGMTVKKWLYQSEEEYEEQGDETSNAKKIITGFGPRAIPLFVEEFHQLCKPLGGIYQKVRALFKKPTGTPPVMDELRERGYFALSLLGCETHESVDRFFFARMKTTNRHEAIRRLDFMGDRTIQFWRTWWQARMDAKV